LTESDNIDPLGGRWWGNVFTSNEEKAEITDELRAAV
jgi:hypothetical protein